VLTASSLALGLAGLLATFAPQELLAALDLPVSRPLPTLIQLLGALYGAFAMANWTARASSMGGIYARPLALGNFAHFLIGALVLAREQAAATTPVLLVVLIIYTLFALIFGWLIFGATGRSR
jgi:hypothetical protein